MNEIFTVAMQESVWDKVGVIATFSAVAVALVVSIIPGFRVLVQMKRKKSYTYANISLSLYALTLDIGNYVKNYLKEISTAETRSISPEGEINDNIVIEIPRNIIEPYQHELVHIVKDINLLSPPDQIQFSDVLFRVHSLLIPHNYNIHKFQYDYIIKVADSFHEKAYTKKYKVYVPLPPKFTSEDFERIRYDIEDDNQ